MNIKKGMYRLSIVLAIVMSLIIAAASMAIFHDARTARTTYTYVDVEKEREINSAEVSGPWEKYSRPQHNKPPSNVLEEPREPEVEYLGPLEDTSQPIFVYEKEIVPPLYQTILAGIISAILSFFIVLYSIRGLTNLALWIINGFRE